MNTSVYIAGILLQAVAGIIALVEVRNAPRKLPWLLIALSSLLIVGRRAATLEQLAKSGRELAPAEVITLLISLLFFLGVILMSRMFRDMMTGHAIVQRSEQAQRASSRYARTLIETSLDPLVTISAAGKITDVNKATEQITGLSREQLIGSDFSDYFTQPEMARAGYQRVLEQGQVTDYPLTVRHRSGSTTDVLYNASIYRNEQGEIAGVFAAARDITERKRAEEALRLSEEQYRTVADFTYDWEYWLAPDGSLRYVSPSCEQITGYRPEEFIADSDLLMAIIHPDDRARVEDHIRQSSHQQSPTRIDFRIVTRSGEERWIGHLCRPVEGKDGRYLGVRASNRDITERKWTEARLAESTQLLTGILEHTPMMAAYLDPKFNFVWVNAAYAATCRQPPSFFLGKNHFALHPNTETQAIFQHVVETGEPFSVSAKPFEFPDQPERGVTYWNWSLIPITDAGGRVSGLVFTLAEVTERIRAEEDLRESEERFKNAFQYSPIGVALISPEGKWLKVNARLCSIVGYSESELLAKSFQDITHPDDLDLRVIRLRRMQAGETDTYVAEKRFLHTDGHVVWVSLTMGLLKDASGAPLYIAQIEDITRRKQTEEELARHREHLEELVEQRSRELEAARDQARRADRLASIGTFAAGIAHEINNPLGMLLLATDVAIASVNQPEKLVGILRQNKVDIERCTGIVRGVLDFARNRSTDRRPLDLNEVVHYGVNFTRRYGEKQGVHLETRLADKLHPVSGNMVELGQVVVNLIHNAVQACTEGGRVTIETQETGNKVQLVVRDNGCGMSPEQAQHIFDPFYTTRHHRGGTGLGLSIVHGIVTSHQGTIQVTSEPGKGTAFTVEFAMNTEEPDRTTRRPPPADASPQARISETQ